MKITEVTERIIGKANLSPAEAKVARVYFRLPTAGKRTKKWVEGLSSSKAYQLLRTATDKVYRTLSEIKRAKR